MSLGNVNLNDFTSDLTRELAGFIDSSSKGNLAGRNVVHILSEERRLANIASGSPEDLAKMIFETSFTILSGKEISITPGRSFESSLSTLDSDQLKSRKRACEAIITYLDKNDITPIYSEIKGILERQIQSLSLLSGETPSIENINKVSPFAKIEAESSTLSPYTFANKDWSDVKYVRKAGDGQRGAWFYVNPARGSIVVKGQEGVEEQLMGTVFLRGMGMNAPDAKIVGRTSLEGKRLSELGDKEGLNGRNPTHYIVMDRVMGHNYNHLSASEEHFNLVYNNLENLGELAVYDLILGNFDRFQLDSTGFNPGNIMFQDGVLCPIDTDCVYNEDRAAFTGAALKKIVEGRGDYESKIARKLAENLGKGVNVELISQDRIKAGMNRAIVRLLEFMSDMPQRKQHFVEICRERGAEVNFPEHVEKFLQIIVKSSKI